MGAAGNSPLSLPPLYAVSSPARLYRALAGLLRLTAAVRGLLAVLVFASGGWQAARATEIRFSNLDLVYDGTPKVPGIETEPADAPVSLWFDEPSLPTPPTREGPVFNRIPAELKLSYSSLSFAAQMTWGLGDGVRTIESTRSITSVDAVLVSWSHASQWPVQALLNPAGYVHPITLSVYRRTATGTLEPLAETTQEVLVPWRPETLPDGSPYPFNGYAFVANLRFKEPVVLPRDVLLLITYNTRLTGTKPMGVAGPYDQLNVALTYDAPTVGEDQDPGAAFWVKKTTWSYPATGMPGAPMLRVNGFYDPKRGSATPPVEAGQYEVTATTGDASARTAFTIQPATAEVVLGRLTGIADGLPHPPQVTTRPGGLALRYTYAGGVVVPTAAGEYPFKVEVVDRNYRGEASGTLMLGLTRNLWRKQLLDALRVPEDQSGDDDDPDGDGLSNLLEYAFATDPAATDPAKRPRVEFVPPATLKLVYCRNRLATDLSFQLESCAAPDFAWHAVESPLRVLARDGEVEWIEASVEGTESETGRLIRLRVERADAPETPTPETPTPDDPVPDPTSGEETP